MSKDHDIYEPLRVAVEKARRDRIRMSPMERAWHFLVEWMDVQRPMNAEEAKRELQSRVSGLFGRIDELEAQIDADLPTAEDVRGIWPR